MQFSWYTFGWSCAMGTVRWASDISMTTSFSPSHLASPHMRRKSSEEYSMLITTSSPGRIPGFIVAASKFSRPVRGAHSAENLLPLSSRNIFLRFSNPVLFSIFLGGWKILLVSSLLKTRLDKQILESRYVVANKSHAWQHNCTIEMRIEAEDILTIQTLSSKLIWLQNYSWGGSKHSSSMGSICPMCWRPYCQFCMLLGQRGNAWRCWLDQSTVVFQ